MRLTVAHCVGWTATAAHFAPPFWPVSAVLCAPETKEMQHETYRNYLLDLVTITKEHAREAIRDHRAAKGSQDEDFQSGYVMGFHRLVTLMQQQAQAFGIPLEDLELHDIDESEFFGRDPAITNKGR